MINSWQKNLSKTDLGKGGTHDKYLNIPKHNAFFGSDKNPTEFYNRIPGLPKTATIPASEDNYEFVEHIDKKTGQIYNARFEWAKTSKQTRLYNLAECYNARKPQEGDVFVVEKIVVDNQSTFIVDILRNGKSLEVLSVPEIEKTLILKKILRKKPETNIFLEKINQPIVEKHRTGKARRSEDIVLQAEIYKVSFTIENKTFVYVGQDSYCSGIHYYFGSSILTDFCKLVYGEKIFNKVILFTLENVKQKDLNDKEWESIYNARIECKKKGWININREVQK